MRRSPALLLCVCALAALAALIAPATATASGGEVGTTTVYPDAATNVIGLAQAYRLTASATGAVDRLDVYLDAANTARRVEIGLYIGSSRSAGARVGSCVISVPTPDAWNRCAIPAYTINQGTDYWLAVLNPVGSSGTLKYREAREKRAPATYPSQSRNLSSLPALWVNGKNWSNYRASVYADGSPAVPEPPDADGDGVPDGRDQCPSTPGPAANGGCPTGGAGLPSGATLREPDGGTNYFSRFVNHGPLGDPNYFPLWLWGQYDMTSANVATDKALGFNGYDQLANQPGVYGEPTNMMDLLAGAGMPAFIKRTWPALYRSSAVVGYRMTDEPDMCVGCPQAGLDAMATARSQAPTDGRIRFSNYGKGVLFWWDNSSASAFVNTAGNNDVFSADAYWFTDPDNEDAYQGQCFYNGCGVGGNLTRDQRMRAYNYGLTVRRLRDVDAMDGKREPIFGQIEMARWETDRGDTTITPDQMHAAFWQTVIFGARGVDYFPFSWGVAGHVTDHVQRSSDRYWAPIQQQAKADNALAAQLAPVLNDDFVDGYVTVSSGNNAMAKYHDGRFYVFAGNKDNAAKTAIFTLAGEQGTAATVIGENRTVPISSGRFTDAFADGNAIHIYRID